MQSGQKWWSVGDTLQTRKCVSNGVDAQWGTASLGDREKVTGWGRFQGMWRIKAGEEFEADEESF